jgi:RNA polymerase sigma-70 factor, ECF subfamily
VMRKLSRRRNLQAAIPSEIKAGPHIAIPTELELTFRAHHGLVFRTAYRITGNAADAEDVLQTVFLRLVRRSLGGEPWDNPESYLRRAAINAALDVIRSRRAEGAVELTMDLPHDDAGELRRALAAAMAQLPTRSAEVFTLRFLEGFTNPEIAKIMGISRVLVAVIVHRARQQLRSELGKLLGDRS